jgi:hypothetical protein
VESTNTHAEIPERLWCGLKIRTSPIDYRCEDRRKVGKNQEATLMLLDRSWSLCKENPNHHPQKTNRSARRCISKVPLLSWSLKLSNPKPGCRISALCFRVKKIPPLASWHQDHSVECFFLLLIPKLTPVFLCWKAVGVGDCHATLGHRKTIIFTSIAHASTSSANILN